MKLGFAIASMLATKVAASPSSHLRSQSEDPVTTRQLADAPSTTKECLNPFWKTLPNRRSDLVCTANDVRLATVKVLSGPETCNLGEDVNFQADFCLELSATARYDIGLWLLSGDPDFGNPSIEEFSGAYDGDECILTSFPFYREGDPEWEVDNSCGDILEPERCIQGLTVTVPCRPNENERLNLPYCTSWDQNQNGQGVLCTDLDHIQPGSKSKCSCGNAEADIRICAVELAGFVAPSCAGGQFDFEAVLQNTGDDPIVTWEITDGPEGVGSTETGIKGSFTGLAAGEYELKVSVVDGGCEVLDVPVAGTVMVYDDLSVDASLTGTCESTFSAKATVTGGRGGGLFEWKYASGSGVGTVGEIFSIEDEVNGFNPGETGEVIVEVTYTEPCPDCFDGQACVASSTSDPEVGPGTVYDPLVVTVEGLAVDAVCADARSSSLPEGILEFSVTVEFGSGSYTLASTNDPDELTCVADVSPAPEGACTVDTTGDANDCFNKLFSVLVTDEDARCGDIQSAGFSVVRETTYIVEYDA